MKSVVILGSTGSIGRATVEVIRNQPDNEFKVVGLVAGSNIQEFEKQLSLFTDAAFALGSEKAFEKLIKNNSGLKARARTRTGGNISFVVRGFS